jgi:hypothetical protein
MTKNQITVQGFALSLLPGLSRWIALFGLWTFGISLVTVARAENLSGVYENTGSQIPSDAPPAGGTVSFQGLLGLNFDYALTRALHADTNRVVITQTDSVFRIECRDLDGKVVWSGQWEQGVGCTPAEDRVDLIFHTAGLKYDGYRFSLRPVPGKQLLLVEVQFVKATTLGPSLQPIGSFLFERLSAGSSADRAVAGL